jgi:phosphoribosylanthranilate isomerase
MALKTTVAVGNITNLSEARYCAGMGVQYLCFPAHRIDPKTFKEITGWVNGPTFIIDVSQIENAQEAMNAYAADHWLLSQIQCSQLHFSEGKKIFLDARTIVSPMEIDASQVSFIVIREEQLDVFPREMSEKLLVTGDTNSLISKMERTNFCGLWLEGTEEERPGLKDYSKLETVLEKLDVE